MTETTMSVPETEYDPARQARAHWSAAAMAGVILIWCVPMLMMLVIVPKFDEITKDFGVALPGITAWLFDASRWLLGTQAGQVLPGAVIAVPLFLVALGAAMVLVMRERSWIVLMGVIVLPILASISIMRWMYSPLVAMIESLQGGGGP